MAKWYSFGKNRATDDETLFLEQEAILRQRFEEAVAAGHPRQQLLFQIEQESSKLEHGEDTAVNKAKLRVYDLLYGEIRSRMFSTLTDGKNYEMAGQTNEAIRCFQAAIQDQVPTRFPYEHLRVIYRQRQQEVQALEVCKMALQNPYLSEKDHDHFRTWISKLDLIASSSSVSSN